MPYSPAQLTPPTFLYDRFSRGLVTALSRLAGWRFDVRLPEAKKFVLIGAPHTSNWDWLVYLALSRAHNLRMRYAVKDTLFSKPLLGWLMRVTGGLPINRRERTNVVQQMVEAFNSADDLILGIAPEGTRKAAAWKSGFYYIALGAGVPIVMAGVDYPTRRVDVTQWFMPSGDVAADMALVRKFFANKRGLRPENQVEPRLSAEQEE